VRAIAAASSALMAACSLASKAGARPARIRIHASLPSRFISVTNGSALPYRDSASSSRPLLAASSTRGA
jgi:hypothetical protein